MGTQNLYDPLIEHWNGLQWSVVPCPNPNPGLETGLGDLAVLAPNDIWAVGETHNDTLVEHWNGAAWSVVPSPLGAWFNSVAALAPDDIWAAGGICLNGCNSVGSYVAHWDGVQWSVVPGPNPGTGNGAPSPAPAPPATACCSG